MAHILSGCKIALTQGRYRWRHDKVLAVLADILEKERGKRRPAKVRPLLSTIAFVKEGQRPIVHSQARQNLLQSAQEWEMEVDLGRRLRFPEAVLSTTLRPDIIMWSLEGKRIILVELTVPWEEGCEEAAERKNGKYQQLVQDCRDKGWTTWLMTVEVGCRGFPAQSAWNLMTKVLRVFKDLHKTRRDVFRDDDRALTVLRPRKSLLLDNVPYSDTPRNKT
ncbi:unconventional myosin-If-like protein [Labeo rohita]|uniref:Unconventional myosin-If-like protein n=1 Tax=Labeo rohita TaxID=84645 RepID=A0A498LX84_LABRO|nr:unconventional myosin-If-like protein [Labeo rohita]